MLTLKIEFYLAFIWIRAKLGNFLSKNKLNHKNDILFQAKKKYLKMIYVKLI